MNRPAGARRIQISTDMVISTQVLLEQPQPFCALIEWKEKNRDYFCPDFQFFIFR